MILLTRLLTCALLLVLAVPAAAGEFTEADAEELVLIAFEATKAGDWKAYADYLHPDDLGSFARTFVSVAEHDDTGGVQDMFFGGLETAGILKLSDEEVFARVMEGIVGVAPGFDEMLASMEINILGSVVEGDQFHVVERVHVGLMGSPYSQIDVTSVKPFEGELRTALSGDLEELMQGMLQMME